MVEFNIIKLLNLLKGFYPDIYDVTDHDISTLKRLMRQISDNKNLVSGDRIDTLDPFLLNVFQKDSNMINNYLMLSESMSNSRPDSNINFPKNLPLCYAPPLEDQFELLISLQNSIFIEHILYDKGLTDQFDLIVDVLESNYIYKGPIEEVFQDQFELEVDILNSAYTEHQYFENTPQDQFNLNVELLSSTYISHE